MSGNVSDECIETVVDTLAALPECTATVAGLARATGYHRGTVHRCLTLLRELGCVVATEQTTPGGRRLPVIWTLA